MAIRVLLLSVIILMIYGCAISSIYPTGSVGQDGIYSDRDENESSEALESIDVRRRSQTISPINTIENSLDKTDRNNSFFDDDLENPDDTDDTNAYLAKNSQSTGFDASEYDCNGWYCSWYEKFILKNDRIILGVVTSFVFLLLVIRVAKIRAKK